MNFNCIFLLALALYGAVSQAYIGSGAIGYGRVRDLGYNGIYETTCGTPYGTDYEAGYEGGYGCRSACRSAAICDTCQCLKTILRPNVIERIPYSCARRVQASACRSACGLYSRAAYGGVGTGVVGGSCSGYFNGGHAY